MPLYLTLLAAATVEALLLCGLSRLLFLAGFRLFGNPRHSSGGWVWHLFRAPGNLIHELSHALVLLAAGYHIESLRLSLVDPQGRGEVVARGRWLSIVPRRAAWTLASIAPFVAGIALVLAIMHLLHLPEATRPLQGTSLGQAVVARASAVLGHVPWHAWPTYPLLLLVLSIGSELAPSDRDVRASLPAMLAVAAAACIAGAFFYAAPVGAPARAFFDGVALSALRHLIGAQELALALCGAASLALLLPMVLRDALLSSDGGSTSHPRTTRRRTTEQRRPVARVASGARARGSSRR